MCFNVCGMFAFLSEAFLLCSGQSADTELTVCTGIISCFRGTYSFPCKHVAQLTPNVDFPLSISCYNWLISLQTRDKYEHMLKYNFWITFHEICCLQVLGPGTWQATCVTHLPICLIIIVHVWRVHVWHWAHLPQIFELSSARCVDHVWQLGSLFPTLQSGVVRI